MAKVLIINAHPKTKAESNTLRLADEFMQTYTQLNPLLVAQLIVIKLEATTFTQ